MAQHGREGSRITFHNYASLAETRRAILVQVPRCLDDLRRAEPAGTLRGPHRAA